MVLIFSTKAAVAAALLVALLQVLLQAAGQLELNKALAERELVRGESFF
jgi:hypothetical protein